MIRSAITFMTLVLVVCLASIEARAGQPHFYFVQLSDTHFGERNNAETTRRIVEEINKLPVPIEFVAVTGDVTGNRVADGTTFTNGLRVLQGLKVPFHLLPGNHDILPGKIVETSSVFTNYTGGFVTKAEYQGVVCVFIYVEPLARSITIDGYDPLKQLDGCLKEAGDKPLLVFHHTPCVEDWYDGAIHPGWPKENKDEWIRILNKYRVQAAIAGHFHRDEMHMLGNVPMFVGPAVAPYWDRPPAFRVYEYEGGKIVSYRTQYLPSGKQARSAGGQ